MARRDHFDDGHKNPNYFSNDLGRQVGAPEMHGQVQGMPADPEYFDDYGDAHEGMRTCDTCGRVDDAGGEHDWVNGECENCDPSIMQHSSNLMRSEDWHNRMN